MENVSGIDSEIYQKNMQTKDNLRNIEVLRGELVRCVIVATLIHCFI